MLKLLRIILISSLVFLFLKLTFNIQTLDFYRFQSLQLDNKTLILNVPITFNNEDVKTWYKIEKQIVTTKNKYINLNWWGYGGYVSDAADFIKAISIAKDQGKIITFNLVGPTISAHALSICEATKINFVKKSYLIFHAPFGKLCETCKKEYAPKYSWSYKFSKLMMEKCIRKGILTGTDVSLVLEKKKMVVVYPNKKEYREDWKNVGDK